MNEAGQQILVEGMLALQASVEGTRVLGADHAAVEAKCLAAATLLTRAHASLRSHCGADGLLTVMSFDKRVACGETPLPALATLADTFFASLRAVGGSALTISSPVEQGDVASLARAIVSKDKTALPANCALLPAQLKHASASKAANASTPPKLDPSKSLPTLDAAWVNIQQGKPIPMKAVDSLADQMHALLAGNANSLLHLSKLKTHDQYTFVHTINVSILSASLAQACGLSDSKVRDIAVGAMLHDVGKGLVPEHILNKRGKLEESELLVMRRHPLDGARLLIDSSNAPDLAVVIAYEHHMHLNRTGYPLPRQDHHPHLASQIVQVADMYDALRTNRPYRAGMTLEKAQEIMMQGAGVTHDKVLLDWFFSRIAYRCVEEPAAPPASEPKQAVVKPARTIIVP